MKPLSTSRRKFYVRTHLIGSVLVAMAVAALLPAWLHLPSRVLCIWDSGMLFFLLMSWWVMLRATPETMRLNAQRQDEGRLVILSLVTTAACASIFAIGFMLKDAKSGSGSILILHVILAAFTILGSWLLVHTIFALHYAHGYYQDGSQSLEEAKAEGLDFPGDIEPDYWDFLYFSFVIGMTSQVSDVQIESRSMRRLALLHGVLSFFFNTAIVAMSINLIAGLIQGG
ncbi:DUF1345 domain-containing protein [Stenomitos frigidus]|nr:DUF1345 domain-containing protein [Stenomitos frigidus]